MHKNLKNIHLKNVYLLLQILILKLNVHYSMLQYFPV